MSEQTAAAQVTTEAAPVVTESKPAVVAAVPAAAAPKVEEKPAPEAKPEAAAKPKESENPAAKPSVVPEKYDLKLPEGSKMEAAQVEKIATFAKAQGLSNEQAQAILERENGNAAEYAASKQEQARKLSDSWLAQAKNDTEIGGEAFAKNAELAKRVVDKFGSEAFKKTLNETGLGNHPELVRFVARLGKTMSEDRLIMPGGDVTGGKKDHAEILYPTTEKQQ